jgi:glyoxylase-like metal-dependent hydrolase (beta-lactamase superfamily II)
MKNIFAFIIAAVFVFSCKEKTKEVAENTVEVQETVPEIRLYALDGGTVQVNQLELFAQDDTYEGQNAIFADAFYVIEHPRGTLMWDAGLPESLVNLPEPYTDPSGAFTVSRKDSVEAQVTTLGMSVDDIEFLALSHTHFDHSGHAEKIKNATWLVQEREYDFVMSDEVKNTNADVHNAVNDLANVKKLQGDFDVFGDGRVIIKSMPGHTPGHQVLYVDLAEHGPLLLAGDLYHFYENREHKRIPIFNYDVKQTLESMDKFETFAVEKGAKVYLQHSKEDFESMPKAPKYLK